MRLLTETAAQYAHAGERADLGVTDRDRTYRSIQRSPLEGFLPSGGQSVGGIASFVVTFCMAAPPQHWRYVGRSNARSPRWLPSQALRPYCTIARS